VAPYVAMSLSARSGRTFTTRREGFALKTCSSFVKGLMPFRAGVAGFWMTVILRRPGSAKTPGPFFQSALLIWVARVSKTGSAWSRACELCIPDSVEYPGLVPVGDGSAPPPEVSMPELSRVILVSVLTAAISIVAGTLVTLCVGDLTASRVVAHSGVVFAPMIAGVLWSLRPETRGPCARWIRALVRPTR